MIGEATHALTEDEIDDLVLAFGHAAAKLKATLPVPVLLTGRITRPAAAEQVLADGQADMVGLVCAHLADPEWLAKASSGRTSDIRLCTGDNEGCRSRTQTRSKGGGMTIGCTVNAAAGREEELAIVAAASPRTILVVGGGPGGMEAARVARLRGHRVVLFERDDRLGGQVLTAALDPRSAELIEAVDYLTKQVAVLDVDVRLGAEASGETIEIAMIKHGAQSVIVATGSDPLIPKDIEPGSAVSASQVLRGEVAVGERVCVVGGLHGHRTPANIAELLADRGHRVDVLTERMFLGENQDPAAAHHTLKRLLERGVRMHPLTGLHAIEGRRVITVHALIRCRDTLDEVDTVVMASGGIARDGLYRELRRKLPAGTVIPVGDCLAPRRVAHAVLEGYRAGLTV